MFLSYKSAKIVLKPSKLLHKSDKTTFK